MNELMDRVRREGGRDNLFVIKHLKTIVRATHSNNNKPCIYFYVAFIWVLFFCVVFLKIFLVLRRTFVYAYHYLTYQNKDITKQQTTTSSCFRASYPKAV